MNYLGIEPRRPAFGKTLAQLPVKDLEAEPLHGRKVSLRFGEAQAIGTRDAQERRQALGSNWIAKGLDRHGSSARTLTRTVRPSDYVRMTAELRLRG